MAGFFVKQSSRGHARSISLPARSHPTTIKIEEVLTKLHNLDVSSSSLKVGKLCMAISGIVELYKSIGDLLKLPQTQQDLTKHHDSSWVNELLEESVSFLDVCGNTRDNMSLLRESLGKLQSAFKRSWNKLGTGESLGIENDFTDYVFSLKNLKREMGKSLSSLKHTVFNQMNSDQHHVAVVRVLRETSLMSSLVFRAILGYFSAVNLQPKPSKWSLVLKMVSNKGHGNDMNELEDVEVALNSLMVRKMSKEGTGMRIESACKKLNELETSIEGIEKELECLFRQLIHIRVSLLNILSNH